MKKIFVVFCTALGTAFAAGPVIGVAVSQGRLEVNKTVVDGNANLSAGTSVKTSASTSMLHLTNGSNVALDRESEAKIFADHVVLERGAGQLAGKNAYAVEAMGFRVTGDGAQARVDMKKDYIIVAALSGTVRVTDGNGIPVANVTPGRALGLQPTSGSATSTMTGRLGQENGRFVLPDETSGLKVELTGKGLDREIGRRIEVSGAPKASADRSTQVIEVARLNRLTDEPVPGPAPSPAPAAGSWAALGVFTKTMVFVGIATAIAIPTAVIISQSN
ncbi:MAG: hypothetical protein NTZ56_03065 [Acidobacteria bacterium]|nr:hypothetical protein [Acidobacteriota bacterium]